MSAAGTMRFEGTDVRIAGTPTDPLFRANDVCLALGYGNPRQAIETHVDGGDVQQVDTPTESGVQPMNYVNEAGLYALIFGSRKPEAKRFKRWVTHEVLPALRKTGRYETPTAKPQGDELAKSRESRLVEAERRRTTEAMMRLARATGNKLVVAQTALDALALLTEALGRRPMASEEPGLQWQSAGFVAKAKGSDPSIVGKLAKASGLQQERHGQVMLDRQSIDTEAGPRDVPLWLYRGPALRLLLDVTGMWAGGQFDSVAEAGQFGRSMFEVYGVAVPQIARNLPSPASTVD
jgi:prophage antirepressor-like protein